MGASNKPKPVDDLAEETVHEDAPTPKVGDILVVTVEPSSNNGKDAAPILVTSVDDEGLVHGLVFRESTAAAQLVGGLQVFASRQAVDDLDAHEDPKVRATRPGYAVYYA